MSCVTSEHRPNDVLAALTAVDNSPASPKPGPDLIHIINIPLPPVPHETLDPALVDSSQTPGFRLVSSKPPVPIPSSPRNVTSVGSRNHQPSNHSQSLARHRMPSADAALMDHASMTDIARENNARQLSGADALNRTRKDRDSLQAKDAALSPAHEDTAPKRKTQSLDYVWRSGVAGGLAGCAAKTVVAPLDRVKILFQARNPLFAKYTGSWFGVATAMKDIYSHEGPLGLYRGHSATLLRIFPYAGIKFLAYEQIRAIIIPHRSHETPMRRLLSGSLAGVTSVFFTYPLEVIRVRLAFETKREGRSSLSQICRQIYHEHRAPAPSQVSGTAGAVAAAATPSSGIVNFYRGFTPTVLGMLPYAGMSFLTHDTVSDMLRLPSVAKYTTLPLKKDHPPGKPAALKSWAELFSGGIAGLISQTVSYPLEVIRRRMQVGGAVGDGHRLRISETAGMIFRERGIPGFFVGLTIGYVKIIPMAAVSFYTYERMKLAFGI